MSHFIEPGIYVKLRAYDHCQELIRETEALEWEDSITFGETPNYRTNQQIQITRLANTTAPNLKKFDLEIFNAFQEAISEYKADNKYLKITRDEGLNLLRYEKGQEYKIHVDEERPGGKRVLSG